MNNKYYINERLTITKKIRKSNIKSENKEMNIFTKSLPEIDIATYINVHKFNKYDSKIIII